MNLRTRSYGSKALKGMKPPEELPNFDGKCTEETANFSKCLSVCFCNGYHTWTECVLVCLVRYIDIFIATNNVHNKGVINNN